jgi:hypothetical protein
MARWMVLLALACAACDSNHCDETANRFDECGVKVAPTFPRGACEGKTLCSADCVNEASCEDLEEAFAAETPPLDNAYVQCALDCDAMEDDR